MAFIVEKNLIEYQVQTCAHLSVFHFPMLFGTLNPKNGGRDRIEYRGFSDRTNVSMLRGLYSIICRILIGHITRKANDNFERFNLAKSQGGGRGVGV